MSNIVLQKFLNWFNNPSVKLELDGIVGSKTLRQAEIAVSKLMGMFKTRRLTWNPKYNFIGIGVDDLFDDKFSDYWVLIENNVITAVIPCSTVAGLIEAQKGSSNWVGGLNGVGVLKENQQVDYLVVESTDTSFWHPTWTDVGLFLYQDNSVVIYRDANNNGVIDKLITQCGYFGINIHSWLNYEFDNVTNLSSGCQVSKYNDFVKVLIPFIKRNMVLVKGKKRITYTLIQ